MASIVTEKNGFRLIQLSEGEHPKRPKIRLGKVTKRQADTAKRFIEDLIGSKATGDTVNPATRDWVAGVPDFIRKRLERVGLIQPQERRECPTVAQWVRSYIEGRTDIKPNTRSNMKQAEASLIGFIGKVKRLADVTPGDAEDFRIDLKAKGLAEATIRRRCKRAKQFFTAAVKKRIIADNPFADLKCGDVSNEERRVYVPGETIQSVLAKCPDTQWKLIFALARYAGLRTPSETFRLRWADIHWDRMRFTVHSPKTEGHGKASRVVPLFPRLYRVLLEAFGQAQEGDEYVITRYRGSGSNLRTQAHRIIKRAGLEPWEKTFQNLRASLETELVEQYPIQTVTAWLGNTPAIALKHYLTVREEHFEKAVQIPVQQVSTLNSREPQEVIAEEQETVNCGPMQNKAATRNSVQPLDLPPRGLEPLSPG